MFRILAVLLAMTACAGAVHADPVTIERSEEIVFTSGVTGEDVRLLVWVPKGDAPEGGFPVVYAFDGGKSFGLLADIAASVQERASRAGRDPVMIVGIGYPAGAYTLTKRTYDLTPASPTGAFDMPERPNLKPWPKMGGGDATLEMLETEAKPLIEARFPVDTSRETLLGHSFGGMMVLHALFTQPDSFETFVAISPSLWFNGTQLFDEANAFLAAAPPAGAPKRLYMAVGGDEEKLVVWDKENKDVERYAAWKAYNRMVGNAKDLAALFDEKGAAHVDYQFMIGEGEDHSSMRARGFYKGLFFAADAERP